MGDKQAVRVSVAPLRPPERFAARISSPHRVMLLLRGGSCDTAELQPQHDLDWKATGEPVFHLTADDQKHSPHAAAIKIYEQLPTSRNIAVEASFADLLAVVCETTYGIKIDTLTPATDEDTKLYAAELKRRASSARKSMKRFTALQLYTRSRYCSLLALDSNQSHQAIQAVISGEWKSVLHGPDKQFFESLAVSDRRFCAEPLRSFMGWA